MLLVVLSLLVMFFFTTPCFAAGGVGVKTINYYHIVLHALGVQNEATIELWTPVLGGLLTLSVLVLLGLYFRNHINKLGENIVPDRRFNLATALEMMIEFVDNLVSDIIGKKASKPFLPLLAGLFLFILFSNLSGLVPGFPPATESMATNLAMGLSVFLVYNIAGARAVGLKAYAAHFLGPVLWLAPLILVIELIGHLVRPYSLGLRLYGNIFGDHLVLSVFSSLMGGVYYLPLPALLCFFGLLVACLQSYVFTLLSSIYISLAVSHDH